MQSILAIFVYAVCLILELFVSDKGWLLGLGTIFLNCYWGYLAIKSINRKRHETSGYLLFNTIQLNIPLFLVYFLLEVETIGIQHYLFCGVSASISLAVVYILLRERRTSTNIVDKG